MLGTCMPPNTMRECMTLCSAHQLSIDNIAKIGPPPSQTEPECAPLHFQGLVAACVEQGEVLAEASGAPSFAGVIEVRLPRGCLEPFELCSRATPTIIGSCEGHEKLRRQQRDECAPLFLLSPQLPFALLDLLARRSRGV